MNAEESYNYWQPHNWATKLSKNPIMLTKEQAIRFAEAYAADTLAELKRVKKERDEFKDFVREFYNLKNPSNKQWLEITEKAKQLLTSKE